MKKTIYSVFVIFAAFIFGASCTKEVGNAWEEKGQVVDTTPAEPFSITVTIPQDMTKISFEQENKGEAGDKVKLTWDETDELVIVDNGDPTVSRNFIIPPSGISVDGKTATFTMKDGQPAMFTPSNGKYDVLYGAASLEEAQAKDYSSQTQTGNASLDGLENNYIALASGVNTIENVELGKTWAEANGGTFKETGIIRLWLQMPTGVESIASVTLNAPSAIFYKSNALQDTEKISSMKLAFSGNASTENVKNTVTGYLMMPWEDVAFVSDTDLSVIVQTEAGAFYSKAFTVTNGTKFDTGCVNAIKISKTGFSENTIFAAGAGTAADPWLIANKVHMGNIAANLAAGETKYFKMIDDVDMDGVSWTALNPDPFTCVVNFDGNDKKISHLGASLFDDLNGTIVNLTIEDASVSGGANITGILANTIKTAASTVTNVDVVGTATSAPFSSSVSGTSGSVGALIGEITNVGGATMLTASDCDIQYTSVSGLNNVGGIVGYANGKVSMSECSYDGSTVSGSGQYIAGAIGRTGNFASSFVKCSVENATITGTKNQDIRMGGLVGLLEQSCVVKGCSVGTSTTKVVVTNTTNTADSKVLNIGGFVGVCYGQITKDDADNRNKAYVNITSANTKGQPIKIGGFVGYHTGNISYSDAVVDMSTLQGQYIGGFAGWAQKASASKPGSFDNCKIQGAVKGNNYTGGFIGYVDSGTPSITNNTVLSETTVTGQSAAGGFVGYTVSGTFTDNTVEAISVSSSGSNVGGFVGWVNAGTFNSSGGQGNKTAASVTSTGGSPLGGFAGYIVAGSFSDCSCTGDVTQQKGRSIGGFVGRIYNNGSSFAGGNVSLTRCHSASNVIINLNDSSSNGDWVGGFIGLVYADGDGEYSLNISKCYSTGNVGSSEKKARTRAGGFIGQINSLHWNVNIEDCYARGNVYSNDQVDGGFIACVDAVTGTVSIARCYASGDVMGRFRVGGFIGFVSNAKTSIVDCAAWNGSVTASAYGSSNWSSGAFEGTAFPTATLTNNFRSPDMSLTAYWVPSATFDHPDVNGSSTSTYLVRIGTDLVEANAAVTNNTAFVSSDTEACRWAYHGKHSTTSRLSALALTAKGSGGLGWSDTVWDFSADLPTLK